MSPDVDNEVSAVNIVSSGEGLAAVASNFAATPFVLDGVAGGSVEGVIQALKEPDPVKAARIAAHSGFAAKRAGTKKRNRNVRESGSVWWKGRAIPLRSEEHYNLVKAAILAKFRQHPEARRLLLASGNRPFVHDLGKRELATTSYPSAEFIAALYEVRETLRSYQVEGNATFDGTTPRTSFAEE